MAGVSTNRLVTHSNEKQQAAADAEASSSFLSSVAKKLFVDFSLSEAKKGASPVHQSKTNLLFFLVFRSVK